MKRRISPGPRASDKSLKRVTLVHTFLKKEDSVLLLQVSIDHLNDLNSQK